MDVSRAVEQKADEMPQVREAIEAIQDYARPLIRAHGRKAAVVGLGALALAGLGIVIARRRRRRSLSARLRHAVTASVGPRIERPLSSIMAAADRFSG